MRIAIIVLFAALSGVLVYLLYESIRRPIEFKNTREAREVVVRERLTEIAELQKLYKTMKGDYASTFDSLKLVLTTDSLHVEKVIGDPNDSTKQVERTMVLIPARDTVMGLMKKSTLKVGTVEEYLAELQKVPFAKNNELFKLEVGSAPLEGTDSARTSTFQVGTPLATYLSEYDKESYAIYDPNYDPSTLRKVGDLTKPSTSGNW